jgi:predicted nuclease of predicted toxin-antitoxin system
MKLLANENFPKSSVTILENGGFDIKAIGQDFGGILDSEVMEIAISEQRTILTFDRDYGELIFKKGYRPSGGVIYLRWDNFSPVEPGEFLLKLLKSGNIHFEGMLTVINENTIRQRKYPSN